MADLFKGHKLMKKSGESFKEIDVETALRGKVVGLYFSAHWCGPCRFFTPKLKAFYEELEGEPFEIVFVSWDKTDKDMTEYLKEVHGDWCFLSFGDDFIKVLNEKYSIDGIPTTPIIKQNGEVVDPDAREKLLDGRPPSEIFSEWKKECNV